MHISYVFEHGDAVLIGTFLLLLAMSAASWYVIAWKWVKLHRERRKLDGFRLLHTASPDWVLHHRGALPAGACHALGEELERIQPVLVRYPAAMQRELLSTHLAQALDGLRVWLDKGLTLLASVGATAPFIGLFGTVWGVYNALMQLAEAGNASLNVVAGPMGEALVMTALGLFVAIPAVLAYNLFGRLNRVLVQDLRHLAEDMMLYAAEGE